MHCVVYSKTRTNYTSRRVNIKIYVSLRILSVKKKQLRNNGICDKLRGTDSAEALFAILTESQEDRAA